MKKIIIKLLITGFFIFTAILSKAQIYYYEIPKKEYIEIRSGKKYYPAKILFHDGTIKEGYVARVPNSSFINFRENLEFGSGTRVYNERHILSFMYGLNEHDYPKYIFIDVDVRKYTTRIEHVEVISRGKINVYLRKWIEDIKMPFDPFEKNFNVNMQFFLEKNGEIFRMDNYKKEIIPLINDNEEVFNIYMSKKINTQNYTELLNMVNLYNESE